VLWLCCSSIERGKRTSGGKLGEEVIDREGAPAVEMAGATAQPLRALRASARVHSEVRAVPHLFP
jgi:hypothetical protein